MGWSSRAMDTLYLPATLHHTRMQAKNNLPSTSHAFEPDPQDQMAGGQQARAN